MCEATITKRLNEFADTEAGSLTVSNFICRIMLQIDSSWFFFKCCTMLV